MAYQTYHLHPTTPLYYYRTTRGTRIDLVIDRKEGLTAIRLLSGKEKQ